MTRSWVICHIWEKTGQKTGPHLSLWSWLLLGQIIGPSRFDIGPLWLAMALQASFSRPIWRCHGLKLALWHAKQCSVTELPLSPFSMACSICYLPWNCFSPNGLGTSNMLYFCARCMNCLNPQTETGWQPGSSHGIMCLRFLRAQS